MSTDKQEVIRHVNEMIEQLKNKTYKSPFSQAFTEIYIEDGDEGNEEEDAVTGIKDEEIINRQVDPKRELFLQMRQLSRDAYKVTLPGRTIRDYIFYQQAKFMAEYEDDYGDFAECSMYYPNYQMMSYEQLRTFFSWRSRVRMGNVQQTDLSYVFLYLYELINNIGVKDSEDGINKLLFLWNSYRQYSDKLDKYMALWVKEFYILNECSFSFDELLQREKTLQKFYPKSSNKYSLDYYNGLSSYKIKQSVFMQGNEKLLEECFCHIINKLNELLSKSNVKFENLIFYRGTEYSWYPFTNAIYYPKPEHWPRCEKTVKINDSYEYLFKGGRWLYTHSAIVTENGKQIVGYILKRMEQLLRQASNFKYKLIADSKQIKKSELDQLVPEVGYKRFFAEVDAAIKEFFVNSRRTVVTVDRDSLERIRQNALLTQEKLIVSADDADSGNDGLTKENITIPVVVPKPPTADVLNPKNLNDLKQDSAIVHETFSSETIQSPSAWDQLVSQLNPLELQLLNNSLKGISSKAAHEFARSNHSMLEVLIDNINQKAIDSIGDTILELSDEVIIFDEYKEHLGKAVGCE